MGSVKRSIKDETLVVKRSKPTSSPIRSTAKIEDEEINESKSKSKPTPDIEIISSISSSKKSNEQRTIHPRSDPTGDSNKKSQRDRKSSSKTVKKPSAEQQKNSDKRRRHSSSTNSSGSAGEKKEAKPIQPDNSKHQSAKARNPSERFERSDRTVLQSTPPVVQLSPPSTTPSDIEKAVPAAPHSPICVILDEDSSPTPPVEKKVVRQSTTATTKKSGENKSSPKQTKRSRDSDKTRDKETKSTNNDSKRKRLNDGNRKTESSSKGDNDSRSTSIRSDTRRNVKDSSRDDSLNRKRKQEKSESTSANDVSTKPRSSKNNDRRDATTSSSDNKRPIRRRGSGKEKGLENVTDAEEHNDEPVLPKQTAFDAYTAMDWSLLSRDRRIPLNSQTTSRAVRFNGNNMIERLGVAERLLTSEQKERLKDLKVQSSPLTHFMAQLQSKSASQIVHSCDRRFGSCAKDMIDMRHKWFTRSIEPVQQYDFINKEHYLAFQQAIGVLLNRIPNEGPIVQIETTTAETLLSNAPTAPSILPV